MAGHLANVSYPDVKVLKQAAIEILKLQLHAVKLYHILSLNISLYFCVSFQFEGIKDLVLDGDLMKPLDRIVGAQFLKVK